MPFFSSADKAITAIVIVGIFLLVAFPFHEFAHALAAYRLGDGTARLFGRLTLDPRAHFDPMGGLLLAVTMISSGGTYGFGWAKPTPVAPHNLRGGRQGEAIVAFAGPASNIVLAAAAALQYRYIEASGMEVPALVDSILVTFIVINVLLLVFNLIPIPPLDGSGILAGLLSGRAAQQYERLMPYGFLILLVLMYSRVLNLIFAPVQILVLRLFS